MGTACLLGSCLSELPDDVPQSYPDVATLAFGSPGRYVAIVFCFMELFGNACMNLIVMLQEVESLIRQAGRTVFGLAPHNSAILLGSALMLPFFLMGNLKTLSYLSLVRAQFPKYSRQCH